MDAVRKDWLSFLKQGFKIVGVANSDSHGYHEQVGVPRTMVAMTDDSIAGFDLDEFVGTLKQGDAYGSKRTVARSISQWSENGINHYWQDRQVRRYGN